MTTIYAAIIEWPEDLADADPGLILALTEAERDTEIAAQISETADMLAEPEWRDAIESAGSEHWRDWLDPLDETSYSRPFVSLYTREIPA